MKRHIIKIIIMILIITTIFLAFQYNNSVKRINYTRALILDQLARSISEINYIYSIKETEGLSDNTGVITLMDAVYEFGEMIRILGALDKKNEAEWEEIRTIINPFAYLIKEAENEMFEDKRIGDETKARIAIYVELINDVIEVLPKTVRLGGNYKAEYELNHSKLDEISKKILTYKINGKIGFKNN